MQRHDDALGYASSSRGPRARVSDQITKCSFLLGKPKPKKKKTMPSVSHFPGTATAVDFVENNSS